MPKKAFEVRRELLRRVAEDLRYLLAREYHKGPAVNFVGNRWALNKVEREILKRAVFAPEEAAKRRRKLLPVSAARGKVIQIDTYNVLYTIEAGLLGLPVFEGDDGLVRDVRKLFPLPRQETSGSLDALFNLLQELSPGEVLFFLDRPLSKSGELAAQIRSYLVRYRLTGKAFLTDKVDQALKGSAYLASSDAPLVDQAANVFDLAREVLFRLGRRPFSLGA